MSRFPEAFRARSSALTGCLAVVLSASVAGAALAGPMGLGRAATDEEVAAWDIDIRPDGAGLPVGSGSVLDGEEVFVERCAICHGDFGEGVDRWPVLAGGQDTLSSEDPVKTIGSYWPYLSTVYDYIHRAMPFGDAQSLEPDQVYAITAYLLYMNDVVEDEDFVLSNENFADVRLPNEDNFFMDDREEAEPFFARAEVCMENCKDSVEITARARVIDVTPEETAAKAAQAAEAAATQEAAAAPESEAAPATAAPDPELVAAGERVFKKCQACHQVGEGAKNRVGPILTGIVGGAAGQVEDFNYSKALADRADEGLVWTSEELHAFLTKPKDYLPRTKMSFNGLRKPEEIDAVIAYLQSFGG